MAPNEEIKKIMLDCKSKGLNSRDVLQLMEVPYDCPDDSYIFDFGSMTVDELSEYIDYILRMRWYLLDNGTPTDGLYKRTKTVNNRYYYTGENTSNHLDVKCWVEVNIYSSGEKTYLEISMPYKEDSTIEKLNEKKMELKHKTMINESNEIIDQIKFLKPSIKGYLICNKCGSYYEVHDEESPADFPYECECGGTFDYIAGPKQPEEKSVERKEKAVPTEYLRAPTAMILVSLACFVSFIYHVVALNFIIGLLGVPYGLSLILLRHRRQELVLNMISRRSIYLLAALIFFGATYGLISVIIQINDVTIMIGFSILTIVAAIYGLGMIFKTISPDDSRNFLNPPL